MKYYVYDNGAKPYKIEADSFSVNIQTKTVIFDFYDVADSSYKSVALFDLNLINAIIPEGSVYERLDR